jgi:hypothetical protein
MGKKEERRRKREERRRNEEERRRRGLQQTTFPARRAYALSPEVQLGAAEDCVS